MADVASKAYLAPKYQHDIFVSYAHGALVGKRKPLAVWSHGLVPWIDDIKNFRAKAAEFADLNIFNDWKLDPTVGLTSSLKKAVSNSAILMIIMSPAYLESDWCGKELDWFGEQIESRRGDTGRVFIVRAIYTDRNTWPSFLRDEANEAMLGFPFHDAPSESDPQPEPYGYPDFIEGNPQFRDAFKPLKSTLMRRLRQIRLEVDEEEAAKAAALAAKAQQTAALLAAMPKPKLYLHTRPGDTTRPEIEGQILGAGFELIPPPRLSGEVGTVAADLMRLEQVRKSDALVLFRSKDENAFDGDLEQIGIDDRRRVMRELKRPLPCAVFDKVDRELPLALEFGIERFEYEAGRFPIDLKSWFATKQKAIDGARL